MQLRRMDLTRRDPWVDVPTVHREESAPARDVYGRTLDEAREADQRDYVVRKSRVDHLGRRQVTVLRCCCWLLAATIPISALSPTWVPAWWPGVVFGTCVVVFWLAALMQWLLAFIVGRLGVEPPRPPHLAPAFEPECQGRSQAEEVGHGEP